MALVNVTNVIVLDNPTVFTNPFQFEVEFECLGELEDDLEWKVTYVGSAEDLNADQVLEEVCVGPVPVGISKFVLQADAPDPSRISQQDLVGVTVVLITCSYREKEFVRIGYYVNNEYYLQNPLQPMLMHPHAAMAQQASAAEAADPNAPHAAPAVPQPVSAEELQEMINAGTQLNIQNVYRNIMHEKPRVTRFQIDWTSHIGQAANSEGAGGAAVGADGMAMKQEAEAMAMHGVAPDVGMDTAA